MKGGIAVSLDYELHIVAFIDLLGYKDQFKSYLPQQCKDFSCNPDIWGSQKCNHCIEKQNEFLYEFNNVFQKIKNQKYGLFNESNIKLVNFSDNYLFAMPLRTKDLRAIRDQDLYDFFQIMSAIELMFPLHMKFLVRGGIDIGPLFISEPDNLVFGQGLISSYTLESNKSGLPRIAISQFIGEHCMHSQVDLLRNYVEKDSGGFFLNFKNYYESQNDPQIAECGCRLIDFVVGEAEKHKNNFKLFQKYDWICKYLQNPLLDRYIELIRTHPYLFFSPGDQKAIEIVTDLVEIRKAQKEWYHKADELGLPNSYFDIGVISEDEWYLTIRDLVTFPNGERGLYVRFVCKKGRFQNAANVIVIPFHEEKLMISRQFIHTDRKWRWQSPRGFGEFGLSAEENAAKELREEIGCEAEEFIRIFRDDNDSDNVIFLARLAYQASLRPLSKEVEIQKIDWVSLDELKDLILSGNIVDQELTRLYIYLSEYGFPTTKIQVSAD